MDLRESPAHLLVTSESFHKSLTLYAFVFPYKKSENKSFQSENSTCCDMGQNDTIGKIELNPSFVLSSDETNCKNDIQLFHQLFDELCVNRDYH